MLILDILLISMGLAMDAFAVSVCKGLALEKINIKKAINIGIWFGSFQAIMPIVGFYLGNIFASFMQVASHWIAFGLLIWIGISMIRETKKGYNSEVNQNVSFSTMLPLAVATSIDALTVGITFSFLQVNIWSSALCIGIITLVLSMLGVKIGNCFGNIYEKRAQLIGGTILIILGIKILLVHFLGV